MQYALVTAILLLLPLPLSRGAVTPAHVAAVRAPAAPVSLAWVRVDPQRPLTVYVGGMRDCPHDYCPLLERSDDGGATWTDLRPRLGNLHGFSGVNTLTGPAQVASDGQRLYIPTYYQGAGPHDNGPNVLLSGDGGYHWRWSGLDTAVDGSGLQQVALSPISTTRVYGVYDEGSGGGPTVYHGLYSDDAGATWQAATSPTGAAFGVVPDPQRLNTIYANVAAAQPDPASAAAQPFAARSDDAGLHWSPVMTPTVAPALTTFTVATDPHEGALLVGQTYDAGVPADRRFLSADEGRTWRVATCPGDAAGACPRFTVDDVLGPGASYGFVRDGVYPFHGGGSAGTRLALSSRLPFRHTADLIDVATGTHAGDPIYLLGQGVSGNVHGLLYRSSDGGKSWQRLAPGGPATGTLPSTAPPSHAPGALYVPRAHHSVAAPFVAAYRRMSPLILGDPVTEAYTRGATLTQDFDHLRLELHDGQVVVGSLGSDVFATIYTGQGLAPAAPAPTTPARLYFPQTRHTLQGDMLRYWQNHGGLAVFGAPLSEVVSYHNGDGSGRTYQAQWFQKARLERHPENHDSRYAILLGLLGKEWWRAS